MDFGTSNLKKCASAHLTKFRLTSGFHKLRVYALCAVWVLTRCVSIILIYYRYLGCIVKIRGESLSYVFNWLTNVCLGWFILKIGHILYAVPVPHFELAIASVWNAFEICFGLSGGISGIDYSGHNHITAGMQRSFSLRRTTGDRRKLLTRLCYVFKKM